MSNTEYTSANTWKLSAEAYRLSLAYVFDPYMAIHSSGIEPLPHQISAVYHDMLPRMPLRYVLADDPGAGKTIMTGLFLRELFMRGQLKHCLIVCPGSLAEQWQEELLQKFRLNFSLLTDDVNSEFCIARLDKLARDELLKRKVQAIHWDVIAVDEAHKMSATINGNNIYRTKRFRLGQMLSGITDSFLLLSATPHNGKPKDFRLFMSLIDPDRFEGISGFSSDSPDVSGVMRRLLKEDLVKFDGSPLFPQRKAYTVSYDLSEQEASLYDEVTDYVRTEFNRADKLTSTKRRNAVGFALTTLQRRLASSPEAIYQSLKRRHERLTLRQRDYASYDDEDEYTSAQIEEAEDYAADYLSAAENSLELEAEITILRQLITRASEVRASGEDRKWNELSLLLQDNSLMFSPEGQREKLIIFTEHRDTLNYLAGKISSLLGDSRAVAAIHGGISRHERRKTEALFRDDENVRILIATDAAGEGINLQRAHLMVNYDLPWNPNRIEQRFGRIHRIGQNKTCHLWNLVAKNTREGQVFQRLFTKLEEERKALGGKVFDVLGKIQFDNKSLRELLIEAIRHNTVPDFSVTPKTDRRITDGTIDVPTIRTDIARTDTRKLQPYYVRTFFLEAFTHLGGRIHPRGRGTYELTFVPNSLRQYAPTSHKICFDTITPDAEPITPGTPLLEALIKQTLNPELLLQGTVLTDTNATESRTLYLIEHSITDGIGRTLKRGLHFVEVSQDGTARDAGNAPYLDYTPADTQNYHFAQDTEAIALDFAQRELIPASELMASRQATLKNTARAVRERMTGEIQHWDFEGNTIKADELEARMRLRLAEIEAEREITVSTPVITGRALIVPPEVPMFSLDTQTTESLAMRAVMDIERNLGYIPRDVSSLKCGYDIESGDAQTLRFIEVKGRARGAQTVTVTAQEIITALNSPENFILALVEIDGEHTTTTYLKRPFTREPDFSAASVNFNITKLIHNSECIYKEDKE